MEKPLTIDEQLSAFADGELPRAEAELLLARLARDPALRARWSRYHAVGEAMRRGLPARWPTGLAEGVARAIADEPVHAGRGAAPAWLRPLAGVAVAAGVAIVGVMLVRAPGESGAPVAPLTAGVERAVPPGAVTVDYSPAMQARLGAYVVRHGEMAGRALPSVAPHVRVAARDAEELPATAPSTRANDPTTTTPP